MEAERLCLPARHVYAACAHEVQLLGLQMAVLQLEAMSPKQRIQLLLEGEPLAVRDSIQRHRSEVAMVLERP